MIELNLALRAVHPDISSSTFWRWLLGTVVMLPFGFGGENHLFAGLRAWGGFFCGQCAWLLIFKEIFTGEAGRCAARGQKANAYVKASFNTMRSIAMVG